VSDATVFNYFPTKESLFFGQMQSFEEGLVQAVRERPAGESVVTAFRRFIEAGWDRLSLPSTAKAISLAARIIGESPALRARERQIVADYTDALGLLAEETGRAPGDMEACVVAHALMGAHRAIVAHVRARVTSGRRGKALATGARSQAERVFGVLDRGLKDYGVR
jgi:AcrR family transcriptional regulator